MLTEKEQSICREQVFGSLRDFRDLLQLEVTDDDLLLVYLHKFEGILVERVLLQLIVERSGFILDVGIGTNLDRACT